MSTRRPGAGNPGRDPSAYRKRPVLPAAPRGDQPTAPHRRPAQRTDAYRAGRDAEVGQVHLGQCPGGVHPPTDATEATRIVTWYPAQARRGRSPTTSAAGATVERPIVRGGQRDSGLTFDFDSSTPTTSRPRRRMASTRTRRRHHHRHARHPRHVTAATSPNARCACWSARGRGPAGDAVVFPLRTLNAADLALLKQIGGTGGRICPERWA